MEYPPLSNEQRDTILAAFGGLLTPANKQPRNNLEDLRDAIA